MNLKTEMHNIFAGSFSGDDLYRTAAHELGHGMFVLKHTFDGSYKIPPSTTDNLMDYSSGTHIAKWQWDLIHDPGVRVRIFERDGDAMRKDGNICVADVTNSGTPVLFNIRESCNRFFADGRIARFGDSEINKIG